MATRMNTWYVILHTFSHILHQKFLTVPYPPLSFDQFVDGPVRGQNNVGNFRGSKVHNDCGGQSSDELRFVKACMLIYLTRNVPAMSVSVLYSSDYFETQWIHDVSEQQCWKEAMFHPVSSLIAA